MARVWLNSAPSCKGVISPVTMLFILLICSPLSRSVEHHKRTELRTKFQVAVANSRTNIHTDRSSKRSAQLMKWLLMFLVASLCIILTYIVLDIGLKIVFIISSRVAELLTPCSLPATSLAGNPHI